MLPIVRLRQVIVYLELFMNSNFTNFYFNGASVIRIFYKTGFKLFKTTSNYWEKERASEREREREREKERERERERTSYVYVSQTSQNCFKSRLLIIHVIFCGYSRNRFPCLLRSAPSQLTFHLKKSKNRTCSALELPNSTLTYKFLPKWNDVIFRKSKMSLVADGVSIFLDKNHWQKL